MLAQKWLSDADDIDALARRAESYRTIHYFPPGIMRALLCAVTAANIIIPEYIAHENCRHHASPAKCVPAGESIVAFISTFIRALGYDNGFTFVIMIEFGD